LTFDWGMRTQITGKLGYSITTFLLNFTVRFFNITRVMWFSAIHHSYIPHAPSFTIPTLFVKVYTCPTLHWSIVQWPGFWGLPPTAVGSHPPNTLNPHRTREPTTLTHHPPASRLTHFTVLLTNLLTNPATNPPLNREPTTPTLPYSTIRIPTPTNKPTNQPNHHPTTLLTPLPNQPNMG
jgi:hypothetical protein